MGRGQEAKMGWELLRPGWLHRHALSLSLDVPICTIKMLPSNGFDISSAAERFIQMGNLC